MSGAPTLVLSGLPLTRAPPCPPSPTWNPALEAVLCYSYVSLEPCAEHIWRHFRENFPQQQARDGPTPTGVSEM